MIHLSCHFAIATSNFEHQSVSFAGDREREWDFQWGVTPDSNSWLLTVFFISMILLNHLFVQAKTQTPEPEQAFPEEPAEVTIAVGPESPEHDSSCWLLLSTQVSKGKLASEAVSGALEASFVSVWLQILVRYKMEWWMELGTWLECYLNNFKVYN